MRVTGIYILPMLIKYYKICNKMYFIHFSESVEQLSTSLGFSTIVRQSLKRFIQNFTTEMFFLTAIASYLCVVIVQYSQLQLIPVEITLYCYYVSIDFNSFLFVAHENLISSS